ncbi:MAG: hypothetical protein LBM01_02405 [Christensenellaceae bacterium]|nr:hypothetical protein [Christensenellaceae bacterium]
MFIPIGGVFVFGGCESRGCIINRIIIGIFNLIMGGISLAFGYAQNLMFLIIIGYVIAGFGLLMIILNLLSLRRSRN